MYRCRRRSWTCWPICRENAIQLTSSSPIDLAVVRAIADKGRSAVYQGRLCESWNAWMKSTHHLTTLTRKLYWGLVLVPDPDYRTAAAGQRYAGTGATRQRVVPFNGAVLTVLEIFAIRKHPTLARLHAKMPKGIKSAVTFQSRS